jgi:hypothetical protein
MDPAAQKKSGRERAGRRAAVSGRAAPSQRAACRLRQRGTRGLGPDRAEATGSARPRAPTLVTGD